MAPPWPWARRRAGPVAGEDFGPRNQGEPGSENGASSFHLSWLLDDTEPLVEVAAVLEVVVPPAVDRLYFWALQVSFLDGSVPRGAAHIGLQWNRNHPASRAVNWGGYAAAGGLLAGSTSGLPSAPQDPNTRDYPWQPGRAYRLRVARVPSSLGRWQGEVTDLGTGASTVIRHLDAGGDRLSSPIVWSEVFARCEHPSVTVRWSGLEATTLAGDTVVPTGLSVNYEARAVGGCDNTTVATDETGILQVTRAARRVAQGTVVDLQG